MLGVLCFTMGGAEAVKPLIELYKKEIEHAEPVGDVRERQHHGHHAVAVPRRRRTRPRARRRALGMGYHNSLLFRYLDTFPRPEGLPEWPFLIPEATPAEIDERIRTGAAAYGTPDEVAVALQKYEEAGVDQVVFGLLSSSMTRDLAVEIIETFGKHVLPQFDKDPVHRTTRQRQQQLA